MVSSTPFAHNITQKKAAPETSANAQQLRQLSIKTGVVRRLFKEESIYKTEVVDAQARVEKLKADGVDGADIRNAERVVKDAAQMVPRTRQALDEAVIALEDLVTALASESEIAGSEEYKTASQQLETVKSGQQAA